MRYSQNEVKGFVDVLMLSETKLDDSSPERHVLVEGYHVLFRFDKNKNRGGIMLYN